MSHLRVIAKTGLFSVAYIVSETVGNRVVSLLEH